MKQTLAQELLYNASVKLISHDFEGRVRKGGGGCWYDSCVDCKRVIVALPGPPLSVQGSAVESGCGGGRL